MVLVCEDIRLLTDEIPSIPVSYTHLDVYKRQAVQWAYASPEGAGQWRARARDAASVRALGRGQA